MMALGAVGLRIIEGVFVLVGTLCLLSLLTLSRDYTSADATDVLALQTSGTLLVAVRYWSHNVISTLAFSSGALLYYIVLYKSHLIPRWLSGWGILGALMALAATVISAYAGNFDVSSLNTYLNIPIGLNELVLAIWLITKGFDSSAVESEVKEKVIGY
jgi:hypothetical protein